MYDTVGQRSSVVALILGKRSLCRLTIDDLPVQARIQLVQLFARTAHHMPTASLLNEYVEVRARQAAPPTDCGVAAGVDNASHVFLSSCLQQLTLRDLQIAPEVSPGPALPGPSPAPRGPRNTQTELCQHTRTVLLRLALVSCALPTAAVGAAKGSGDVGARRRLGTEPH